VLTAFDVPSMYTLNSRQNRMVRIFRLIWINARRFVFATLCVMLCACGRQAEPEISIGIHIWPGYDTIIVARDQGLFKNSGVRLVETPSATESIRAFRNGTIDGAFLTVDEVLRLADNGHDPVVILIMDFSNGADAVLGQPEISKLADLKGKRVGLEPNALGAYMLARTLAHANLALSDVTMVSMPIAETEFAYLEKKVDAVVTYEPQLTRVKNAGANLLFDSTKMPGEITDVLVVNKSAIERSPIALQHLVDTQFEILSQLSTAPDAALSIMAAREQVSTEELRKALAGLTLPDREENQTWLLPNDRRLLDSIGRLATVMRQYKMLSPSFSERDYRDDRFVKSSAD